MFVGFEMALVMHVVPVNHGWMVGVFFKKKGFSSSSFVSSTWMFSVLLNHTARDVTLDVQQRSGI